METMRESETYQTMLTDVERIVKNLSTGDLDLDQVVSQVERGYGLIKAMQDRLADVKVKIENLREDFENHSSDGDSESV
jgi:exodeoxyribonuclease VII small subunit